jgi:Lon protease-like protein
MQPHLLPLFPLQVVLLPGGELPLHIFEDRYKEMIGEVLRGELAFGNEFGVVLSSEKGIVNTGCTATVDQVLRRYPDGRMDILTRGRRRFEIVKLDDQRPFLRGSVDFFDDFDDDDPGEGNESRPASAEVVQRAIDGYNELLALSGSAPSQGDAPLSYRLTQPVPDLGFRQAMLTIRSETERMRKLADFLPMYVGRQRRIQHVKTVAPKNGHGTSPGTIHGASDETGHGDK